MAATQINDGDKLPISQGSDDSFDTVATPAQLAAYVAAKNGTGLPASASLLGSTASGAAQAITLGSGLALSGTTLSTAAPRYSRPALSAFTWVNQGTAGATDHASGPLTILAPSNNGDAIRGLVTAAPTAPYTLTAIMDIFAATANYYSAGLLLQNASSGALAAFGKFCITATSAGTLMASHYSSPTVHKADMTSFPFPSVSGQIGLRVVNDGTNLTYLASRTGFDWLQIAQETVSAAGSPDHIGFFVNPNDNAGLGIAAFIGLLDWEVLNTASPNVAATNARI